MKIFKLTWPAHGSRLEEPCIARPYSASLPGVKCEVCGQTWANTVTIIPFDLPDDHQLRHISKGPLPPDDLSVLRENLRATLGLPSEMSLPPGTEVGRLHMICKSSDVPSFQWPKLQTIVMTEDVLKALKDHGIKGWDSFEVELDVSPPEGTPNLYQLIVTGQGGVARTEPDVPLKSKCGKCGRVEHFDVIIRSIDISVELWDGSDIFRFAPPYNGHIFVTEKTASVFKAAGFTNYDLLSAEQFVQRRNEYTNGILDRKANTGPPCPF